VLCYAFPNGWGTLVFTDDVLDFFDTHKQIGFCSKEFGGQLFARFNGKEIVVEQATGLRKNDKRGRFYFLPSRKSEQKEIDSVFEDGLHFIGDWHTHPQNNPLPSQDDLTSMGDAFKHSKHELQGFVMVIVGRNDFPGGIWVSTHTGDGYSQLELRKCL